MSEKKRHLPAPPGKKKETSTVTKKKPPSIAPPPIGAPEVPPARSPPPAPPGVLTQPVQEKITPLRPPVEPPPFINKEVTAKTPTGEREPRGQSDLLGIPQDVAFQAAAKAKRIIPKPPPSSRQRNQIRESESIIAGSLEDLTKETEAEQLDSPKIALPKPTSYKAPPRPAIDEDELVAESEYPSEEAGAISGAESAMPSLPDISKFTQKQTPIKKKRKTVEYGSIDYSEMLRKPDEPPSHKELVGEIQGIFQKGIKETLVKADKADTMDNKEIERERYRRMFEDYEAAAEKFQEMQLYVNAAQSYAMALVAAFLGGDVSAALWLLDEYDKLPAIIRETEIYQVVKGLIGALRDKSAKKVAMAEEIIENLPFLSFDDKQLIKKCIKTIKARIT